jgi:hypothetical protein
LPEAKQPDSEEIVIEPEPIPSDADPRYSTTPPKFKDDGKQMALEF